MIKLIREEYSQDKYKGKFIKDIVRICEGNIYTCG